MTHLASGAAEAQFVTLGIEREVFGVPVESVLEILDMQPVFRVPEAPAYLLGLIDLRGRSVPVLDLRTKLGLPQVLGYDAGAVARAALWSAWERAAKRLDFLEEAVAALKARGQKPAGGMQQTATTRHTAVAVPTGQMAAFTARLARGTRCT